MAYTRETLNKFGDFHAQKVFQYRTADAHATVSASGYFNAAVENANLETGDIIQAVVGFGTGSMQLRSYVATVDPSTRVVTTTQLTTA